MYRTHFLKQNYITCTIEITGKFKQVFSSMNNRKSVFILIFILFSFFHHGQNEKKEFCDEFYRSSIKKQISLAANLSAEKLKDYYPLIKDTLEKAKMLIYSKSSSQEARLMVDIIDAKLEVTKKNYAKAVYILGNAMQFRSTDLDDSLRCYSLMKYCFVQIRNYVKAYEINSRMELLKPRMNDSVQIDFGINKSSLLAALNFYNEAIKERRAEFNRDHTIKDTDAVASLYNDVGVYFNRSKNWDSAEVSFLKAKEVLSTLKYPESKKVHYEFFKALIGGNLGYIYFNKGQTNKAIPLLKEDIYFSLKDLDYGSAFNSYNLMVECYLKLGNRALAKSYLDSAENLLTSRLSDVSQSLKYLYLKSTFYQAQGDYNKAIGYLNRYFNIKDSLNMLEKEQSLLNSEIAFKIEQKEFELKQTNKLLEQKNLEDAKNKTSRAYMIAGILILLFIIALLILRNRTANKREMDLSQKTEQIRQQNIQIEQTLKEKELLLKEIHHRVKNNLQIINSMLNLHISKTEGTGNETVLREAQQRIGAIALTHQMLYQNTSLSNISLNDYIGNLIRQIEENMPDSGIEVTTRFEANELKLNIDFAVPMGLLINELLTNSFKHAFPAKKKGKITASIDLTETDCIITVSDNGIGLPEDYQNSEKRSMGMDLIYILADQIDSELKVDTDQNGTAFSFKIKRSKFPS